ncbi:heme-binding Shp domain-containing protein [Eggerthella timonensis]|uniref:heme-binding Shp domain-containing protein n=1 Tax=Eggerthella timonensis TaxID=1871008 RepID=UPI000C7643B7|nr:heme-binding Shp domain-containing protein [Eggerthella timonensis]
MTTRIRSACAAACALATVLVLVASAVSPGPAFAAVSAVYTAATNPTYENPATGAIEDAAGSSNVALAESMVTSIVYENALIERDTDGTLYASLRFKLADQISSIALEVSADGSSYEPVEAVQMQTGTDSATSTATADYRFAIPSEAATVRCSMDVIPMGRAVVYFISLGALQEGDADGTFVQTVTPGEGTEDAALAAASAADADASGTSGDAEAAEDEPVQDADDLTGTSPNEGVQEFDGEGREVTGGKQAEASLDGGTLALIAGIAAGVIVVAGVAVYAVYLRPKRAKQASAAAAAAAAASAPAGSGRDKASDAGEALDADERASRA